VENKLSLSPFAVIFLIKFLVNHDQISAGGEKGRDSKAKHKHTATLDPAVGYNAMY